MKNFWTALFLLTLIAISLKFIAFSYIFLCDNLGAFTITAPTIIAILCFIIKNIITIAQKRQINSFVQ